MRSSRAQSRGSTAGGQSHAAQQLAVAMQPRLVAWLASCCTAGCGGDVDSVVPYAQPLTVACSPAAVSCAADVAQALHLGHARWACGGCRSSKPGWTDTTALWADVIHTWLVGSPGGDTGFAGHGVLAAHGLAAATWLHLCSTSSSTSLTPHLQLVKCIPIQSSFVVGFTLVWHAVKAGRSRS